jgi:hypothetical protein
MKARLKHIDANALDFQSFQPEDPECFGFWLNVAVGAAEKDSADDFQVFVCNRAWLERHGGAPPDPSGRHLLLDGTYDTLSARALLEARIDECHGESWAEVVAELSKFGLWEFENYKP